MTPNHALHRTLNQRRFTCCLRAGEGRRYAPTIVPGAHMKRCVAIAFMASLLFLTGCASPRSTWTYDQFPLNWRKAERGKDLIKVIALVPGGGVLAEAIGIELTKRGFVVIPPTSTVNMATSVDFKAISEHHIPARRAPDEMWKLRHALHARGVNAFLIVRSHDFVPKKFLKYIFWQQANLELYSTTEENPFNDAIAGTVFFQSS